MVPSWVGMVLQAFFPLLGQLAEQGAKHLEDGDHSKAAEVAAGALHVVSGTVQAVAPHIVADAQSGSSAALTADALQGALVTGVGAAGAVAAALAPKPAA